MKAITTEAKGAKLLSHSDLFTVFILGLFRFLK
jgi:hypothetical protein